MGDRQLDALARLLAAGTSRRRTIAAMASSIAGGLFTGRASGATCRPAGSTCREHANCCSGHCGEKDRTGRRRCTAPPPPPACVDFCTNVFGANSPAAQECITQSQGGIGLCFTCGPLSSGGTQTICCDRGSGTTCLTYAGATCCTGQTVCVGGTCQSTCGGPGAPCFEGDECCSPLVCRGGAGTGSGASFCEQA